MPRIASEHLVYHFTHWAHLPEIMRRGLLCDSALQASGGLDHEAGDRDIKARRRCRPVPCGARGVVADYVPFYFAPRSPMLFSIAKGNVSTFGDSPHDLVYLVTSVERLLQARLRIVVTDRNAVLKYAAFSDDPESWFAPGFVDWELMKAKYWARQEDGKERRMAECLVHQQVPWSAITMIGVHDDRVADRVRAVLGPHGQSPISPVLKPGWYF